MLCDRLLFWLSTIGQESQQTSRGRVLAFYRIAPCLRTSKFPRGNYQPIVPRQKHSIITRAFQRKRPSWNFGFVFFFFFFRSATVCNSVINTHARRFWWAHGIIVSGGGLVRKPGEHQRRRLLFDFITITWQWPCNTFFKMASEITWSCCWVTKVSRLSFFQNSLNRYQTSCMQNARWQLCRIWLRIMPKYQRNRDMEAPSFEKRRI